MSEHPPPGTDIKVVPPLSISGVGRSADDALLVSEARHRFVFEGVSDGILAVDREGLMRAVNPALCRMLGYGSDELLGKHLAETYVPQERAHASERVKRTSTGESIRFTRRALCKDGSVIIVEGSATAGTDGLLYGILRDVTQREEIAEALRESEQKFKRIFDAASLGIALSEVPEGRVVDANAACLTMLGCTLEQVRGRTTAELGLFRLGETRPWLLEDAQRTDSIRGAEIQLHRPDGQELFVNLNVDRMVINGRPHLLNVMVDITERKRAQLALRDSERMLSLIYHNTSDVLYLIAVEPGDVFRFISVNDTFLRISGYSLNQVIGQPMERVVPASNHELVRGKYNEAITSRRPVIYHGTTELPAGRRHAQITIVPIFEIDGPVTHLLASIVDLTERQQAEDALKAADRRKSEFIATLAHELRNPMAPLRTGLDILDQGGTQDPKMTEVRGMMRRQMAHLVRLVDDLMDVSRISRDAIQLRLEDLSIAEVVRVAVESTRPLMQHREQLLTLQLPQEEGWVKGDRTRLVQVLSNLLGNAAKYTDPRGVIDLSVSNVRDEVVIEVRDNGIGIPPEMLPNVFDLFSQVDRHLDRAQGGLGIGLSIVRKLVTMHGGTVKAESSGEGQGSVFTTRLPRVNAPAQSAIGSVGEQAPARPRRILIVDDNHDAALTLSLLLQRMGQETFTAYDGVQAVEEAARMMPDMILMDIGMPNMNGYEACKALRERHGNAIRIIALSGWGQEEDQQRSAEAGFDQHLVKPISRETLRGLL